MRGLVFLLSLLLITLGCVACGGDDGSESATDSHAAADTSDAAEQDIGAPDGHTAEVVDDTTPGDSDATEDGGGDTEPPPTNGITPLQSLDPEAAFDDLATFGAAFGEAMVVGIGEMAHRQTELLQMRARLTRYLIEEHGFRLVALETDWYDAQAINEYIHGDCSGDPAQEVRDHLRTLWHIQAFADLTQWMCERNQANPSDDLTVIGFNIFQPWYDGPTLVAFAKAHMPDQADALEAAIPKCEGVTAASEAEYYDHAGPATEEDHQACLDALATIEAFVEANEATLLQAMSEEELAITRLHVLSLRGWEQYILAESMHGLVVPPAGDNARDGAMAEIFLMLRELRRPEAKTVLLAHDWHLAMASDAWTIAYPPDAVQINWGCGTVRMGVHLKAALADQYVPIGLRAWTYFDEVSFETHIDGAPTEPPLIERLMREQDIPMFMLDARDASVAAPLLAPGEAYLYGIPWVHPFTGEWIFGLFEAKFGEQFAGYIYVDTTTYYEPL